jgi:molybdenum cofactor synthesis domain-containing protein
MPDSRANEAGDSPIRLGILTMSDKGYAGQREDSSGAAIREIAAGFGADVRRYQVIPDELELISGTLQEWADSGAVDLILTTGGTGLSPRDVTPEATREILDRDAPGLAELMRSEGLRQTPTAALSRAVAGTRAHTLIINLPGSERGVRESLAAIAPILPHAVATLRGGTGDH